MENNLDPAGLGSVILHDQSLEVKGLETGLVPWLLTPMLR